MKGIAIKQVKDQKNHCKKALVLVQLGIKAVPLSFHKQSNPARLQTGM